MKRKNIFWGVLFILCAVFLLAQNMGLLGSIHINFWTVMWTVLLVVFLLKNLARRDFFGIFFPLALLCIIYDDVLGLEAITPWPVLGAALFLSIGCNMLFPNRNNHISIAVHGGEHDREYGDEINGENVRYKVSFGSAITYVKSENFLNGEFECSFGALKVDFSQAVMKENDAYVRINNSFGEMELFVPANWSVDNGITSGFGGIETTGISRPDGIHTLHLKGENSFGAVTIQYF